MIGVQVGQHRRLGLGQCALRAGLGEQDRGFQPAGLGVAPDPMAAADAHAQDAEIGEAGVQRSTRVTGEKAAAMTLARHPGYPAEQGQARASLRIGAARGVLEQ